ncbi:MAG: N-acetylmuramidase domain-containing protein [Pseudomonadota bacterium]
MFDDVTLAEIDGIAIWLGVPKAALLAVAEVESGGRLGARVKGRFEPLIRFEGHYFDRLLNDADRVTARKAGLASPTAGKVRNPRKQADRWAMLDRAIAINRVAALSSCSWGIGQVMGAHWRRLGFGSADALVELARSGAAGQVKLMARFIAHAGLQETMRMQDWPAFARRYNGPAYAKNQYDLKMEAAYLRWVERMSVPTLPAVTRDADNEVAPGGDLMFGSRGDGVVRLQKALHRSGYVLVADGIFGLVTDRTVRQFQRDHLLVANGIIGQQERDLLLPLGASLVEPLHRFKGRFSKTFAPIKDSIATGLSFARMKPVSISPGQVARAALDCISRNIA